MHLRARVLACSYYLLTSFVPFKLKWILAATASLKQLEKYNPDWASQPRVPSGNPNGGQWTNGGGGYEGPSTSPFVDIEVDDPSLESVYPIEEALVAILGGRIVAQIAKRALVMSGVLQRYSISRIANLSPTIHGAERFIQRGISEKAVQTAIKTARKSGQVVTKIGKYGTPQKIYKGTNGITVIVETEGRNAGKIITLYRRK